jgi:hypothetical protein
MTGVWLAYVITEAVVLVIAVTIYAIFRRRTKSAMLTEAQPDEAEQISF